MLNTTNPQKQTTTSQQKEKLPNQRTIHGNVLLDKIGFASDRVASTWPDRSSDELRSDGLGSFSQQSQNENRGEETLVPLQLWVKPIIRDLTVQRARREGISRSAYGRALYEQAFQQQIDIQYSAILIPIIQKAIRAEMRRAVNLLIPISIDVQVIKQIAGFILEKLPGMMGEKVTELLNLAASRTKAEMTDRLKDLHGYPQKSEEDSN